MRIYNPKEFAKGLEAVRKKAQVSWSTVAKKMEGEMGLHQGTFRAIVTGKAQDIDDEVLDTLMDALPGLSLATCPGVYEPATKLKDLDRD